MHARAKGRQRPWPEIDWMKCRSCYGRGPFVLKINALGFDLKVPYGAEQMKPRILVTQLHSRFVALLVCGASMSKVPDLVGPSGHQRFDLMPGYCRSISGRPMWADGIFMHTELAGW